MYLSISSVCFISRSHFPVSSVSLICLFYFICLFSLYHFTVPRLSVSSFCCICLSVSPFYLVCLVLSISLIAWLICMFHWQSVLSILSVYLICLAYLLSVSSVCLSFCLPIFLSYMPLHVQLTIICLHSLCIYFCVCAGLLRILPFSRRKVLF
jgi:hypothetical protein